MASFRAAFATTSFLADDGATLALKNDAARTTVRMQLLNANPQQRPVGDKPQTAFSNYYFGSDPEKWRTGVVRVAEVKYEQVYPGVDLVFYGNQRQLEYDFIVAPGADPHQIRLVFTGADVMKLDDNGDLLLATKGGELRQHHPVIYQEADGARQRVAGNFVITSQNNVSFAIGDYDPSRALVIDPTLNFSSYLGGGTDNDKGYAIAADSSGNTFVTGETLSTDFPSVNPAGSDQTGTDVFVTKMNSTGTGVSYSTYLGGSGTDIGRGIGVDSSGNAYIAGETDSNATGTNVAFPTTAGAYKTTNQGGVDAFVTKLNSSGALSFSTYLGGSSDDRAYGLALNTSDNTSYVVGETISNASGANTPFPTTASARQTTNGGGYDAFFTRLNSSGTGLSYSTYLGGSTNDYGRAIAVQSSNAYITGIAQSTNFPTAPSGTAYDTSRGGLQDAFVAKINPASGGSSDLVYSTYLGGGSRDSGYGIAVNSSGEAYVTGETTSSGGTPFPTTLGVFQGTNGGSVDVFVTKLNSSGTGLSYSTYLGDTGDEIGYAITLDGSNAIITGETASSSFDTANHLQLNQDGLDAFVSKLNSTGTTLSFSTYHCGNGTDSGRGVTFGSSAIYITGFTESVSDQDGGTFPAKPTYSDPTPAYQASLQGGFDAFVVKMTP
jgi:hypothetical protein